MAPPLASLGVHAQAADLLDVHSVENVTRQELCSLPDMFSNEVVKAKICEAPPVGAVTRTLVLFDNLIDEYPVTEALV